MNVMKTTLTALLLAGLATSALAEGYANPYGYNYGAQPRIIGPAPSGVQPGIGPREFGALYLLQQQQMLDIQRQQLQMMQRQQLQNSNQMRMQMMMDAFGNR